MKIEILGPGCAKCKALEQSTRKAVEDLGIECEITKVTSIDEFAKRGVMLTPALVVDGTVKIAGKTATPEEIKSLLAPDATA